VLDVLVNTLFLRSNVSDQGVAYMASCIDQEHTILNRIEYGGPFWPSGGEQFVCWIRKYL
jgi:hypothetical protein